MGPTNGPLRKLLGLLDSQVFSGSVQWVLFKLSWKLISCQAKEQVEKEREKARLKRAERADATKEKEKQKKDFRELKREEDLLKRP